METRRLGATDLVCSVLGFGTWALSTTEYGPIDVKAAADAVCSAETQIATNSVTVTATGNEQLVNGSSFQIQEVYRGVHNLQAEVLDETGTLMGRSMANRFYVQQNTIVRN